MADPTRSGTIDRGDDFANGEYTVRAAKQKQANVNPAHLEGLKEFQGGEKSPIKLIGARSARSRQSCNLPNR